MRVLYSIIWWLALPLVLARLWWRGRREPGYRLHIAERLGIYQLKFSPNAKSPVIWIHAVSVGETRAAEPLIDSLLATYPEHRIVLTHMTPTGRATGQTLFARHGSRLTQCYLPYDIGSMVRRFLQHFSPQLCLLMETEVWPNLVAQCVAQQVPVTLVNARLSQRSLIKAHKLSSLMTPAAAGLSCVAAQTEADAARLRELGARNVTVTGSIKFDVTPPPVLVNKGVALRQQFGARPVLLCASTREGEEALILDALAQIELGNALLLIVPRHPQRFDDVAKMVVSRGMALCRRSLLADAAVPANVQIVLGDTMGEMFAYYAACDLAFIGGSLLHLGGQNLIEACALGKPVLLGTHTFNFKLVSEDAIAAGAALRVPDATAMLREAARLLQDAEERNRMGVQAMAFSELHRGATVRTMALLRQYLN